MEGVGSFGGCGEGSLEIWDGGAENVAKTALDSVDEGVGDEVPRQRGEKESLRDSLARVKAVGTGVLQVVLDEAETCCLL